jgi:hypothetical protein
MAGRKQLFKFIKGATTGKGTKRGRRSLSSGGSGRETFVAADSLVSHILLPQVIKGSPPGK